MLEIRTEREASGFPRAKISTGLGEQAAGGRIQLYGWDSGGHSWHGPNELKPEIPGTRRLLESLRNVHGRSWYGPVQCSSTREPSSRFFAVVHDLEDCATATLYCDESKSGPAEIVTVIPAARRSRMRTDFAFEFLAFARFLGAIDAGAELEVHDQVAAALAETAASDSLVITISTGLWASDREHVLSRCVEKISTAMLQWLADS